MKRLRTLTSAQAQPGGAGFDFSESLGFWRAALAHVLAERMLRGKAEQQTRPDLRAAGLMIADQMRETRALLVRGRERWGLL